jgi:type 1 fimbria pilin
MTPVIDGERSVSGSLLDLTGNSTLDLTNVSFDSNAQMTFDGTNDYASTSVLPMGTPSAITLECVIRFSSTLDSNDRKVMHYDKTGTTNAVFQLRKGTTNSQLMYQAHDGTTWYTMTDTDAIESDTWVHFITEHSQPQRSNQTTTPSKADLIFSKLWQ